MINLLRSFMLVTFIVYFPIIIGCTNNNDKLDNTPTAINGTLDLSNYDFINTTKPLSISGEWEFYWKEFYSHDDFVNNEINQDRKIISSFLSGTHCF